ncbi:MAG: transglycosylase domain-containing protein [Spirochaetota bacterium]
MRQHLSSRSEYSRWLALKEYPKDLRNILVFSEDKRFFYHPGFDPLAILRASYQNIKHGKIISGASTIPQQLAKIVWQESMVTNRYIKKLQEIWYALALKIRFSAEEILEAYMNRVPFPKQSSGFASASYRLLQKDVHFLSKEEAIALVALLRKPYASEKSFLKRYQGLLAQICPNHCRKTLPWLQNNLYHSPPISHSIRKSRGHFTDWVYLLLDSQQGRFDSYLRDEINVQVQQILTNELRYLHNYDVEQAAVIVLQLSPNKTKLISFLGSADYFNKQDGQVRGNLALRNAGSTLKPFVYGFGMDRLQWRGSTIFLDEEVSYQTGEGTFRPKNYDLKFWGKLTLRESLANSRNVTAVRALQKVGTENFYQFLKQHGFSHLQKAPSFYGSALALGGGGVNLLQLTRLYSSLALEGIQPKVYLGRMEDKDIAIGRKSKVFSKETACILTHILSDAAARRRAFGRRNFLDFPFAVAAKTGTSKDYRDSWTVGYTSHYAVGVWVGNFSGKPMRKISGTYGAGRIFQQVMRYLHPKQQHHFSCHRDYQKVSLCRLSGKRATPACPSYTEVFANPVPLQACPLDHTAESSEFVFAENLEIVSPVPGEIYLLHKQQNLQEQQIPIQILVPQNKQMLYSYTIDNNPQHSFQGNFEGSLFVPPGMHSFSLWQEKKKIQKFAFEVRLDENSQ